MDVMEDDDVDFDADADDDVMMMTILSVLIFQLGALARFSLHLSFFFISQRIRGENSFQNGIAFDLYFGIAFL